MRKIWGLAPGYFAKRTTPCSRALDEAFMLRNNAPGAQEVMEARARAVAPEHFVSVSPFTTGHFLATYEFGNQKRRYVYSSYESLRRMVHHDVAAMRPTARI